MGVQAVTRRLACVAGVMAGLASAAQVASAEVIPPNTWAKLSPTPALRYHAANTSTWVDCSASSVLSGPIGRGFSGPALGGGKIFYFGGAHLSHPGNDVELYDIATNGWQQMYRPEGGELVGQCLPPLTDVVTTCGEIEDLRQRHVCRVKDGGASMQVITPAGRPYVEQTYQQHVWDPIRRKFMNGLGSGLWSYDPATNQWEWIMGCGDLPGDGRSDGVCGTADDCRNVDPFDPNCGNPTMPNQPGALLGTKVLMYDPDLETIVWNAAGRTYRFNYETRRWTEIGPTMPPLGSGERFSAYNPDGHYHLIMLRDDRVDDGNANTYQMYKFNAVNGSWTGINPPLQLRCTQNMWPNAFAYDTVNRVFIVLKSPDCTRTAAMEVWEYDPLPEPDGQWRQLNFDGTPPTSNNRWQPLWYDPDSETFYFLNVRSGGPRGGFREGDTETWAFRYARDGSFGRGSLQWSDSDVARNEGAGSVTINVTRRGGADGAVSVQYATADGTARAGQDYQASSGSVNFADQETTPKAVSVPLIDDEPVEDNETFSLILSNSGGGASLGSPTTAEVTIVDNDSQGSSPPDGEDPTPPPDGGEPTPPLLDALPLDAPPALVPQRDAAAPSLRVRSPRRLRLNGSRAALHLGAWCSERCLLRARATGYVRGRRVGGSLARIVRRLDARRSTRLTLRMSRHAVALLGRRLARNGTMAVRISFSASDAAGNATSTQRSVRLRQARPASGQGHGRGST